MHPEQSGFQPGQRTSALDLADHRPPGLAETGLNPTDFSIAGMERRQQMEHLDEFRRSLNLAPLDNDPNRAAELHSTPRSNPAGTGMEPAQQNRSGSGLLSLKLPSAPVAPRAPSAPNQFELSASSNSVAPAHLRPTDVTSQRRIF